MLISSRRLHSKDPVVTYNSVQISVDNGSTVSAGIHQIYDGSCKDMDMTSAAHDINMPDASSAESFIASQKSSISEISNLPGITSPPTSYTYI